jgi:hypothetical protein
MKPIRQGHNLVRATHLGPAKAFFDTGSLPESVPVGEGGSPLPDCRLI